MKEVAAGVIIGMLFGILFGQLIAGSYGTNDLNAACVGRGGVEQVIPTRSWPTNAGIIRNVATVVCKDGYVEDVH